MEGVLKNSSSTNEKVGAVRHKKNALFWDSTSRKEEVEFFLSRPLVAFIEFGLFEKWEYENMDTKFRWKILLLLQIYHSCTSVHQYGIAYCMARRLQLCRQLKRLLSGITTLFCSFFLSPNIFLVKTHSKGTCHTVHCLYL